MVFDNPFSPLNDRDTQRNSIDRTPGQPDAPMHEICRIGAAAKAGEVVARLFTTSGHSR